MYFSKWCQLRSHGSIRTAYNVIQHGNALGTPSPLSQIPSSVVPSILMEPTLNSEWKKSFTLPTLSLGKQHFSEESLDEQFLQEMFKTNPKPEEYICMENKCHG